MMGKRGQWQFLPLLFGLSPEVLIVAVIGVLAAVMLAFGSLYFFIKSYFVQIAGFILLLILAINVLKNGGVNEHNKWFVLVLIGIAVVLFLGPMVLPQLNALKFATFVR